MNWDFWGYFALQVFFAFGGSLAFSAVYNVHGKQLLLTALGGAAGWAVFLLAGEFLFPSEMFQYFLSSVFISLYSEVMARVRKTPATVFLMPALFPLVPGGPIFYTMEAGLNGDIYLFLQKLMNTMLIAGSIAIGVIMVTSLTRLVTGINPIRGLERIARFPSQGRGQEERDSKK